MKPPCVQLISFIGNFKLSTKTILNMIESATKNLALLDYLNLAIEAGSSKIKKDIILQIQMVEILSFKATISIRVIISTITDINTLASSSNELSSSNCSNSNNY
ncbi:hypothetical protein ACTFIU_001971 [Dictyostelium citrinum]